MKEIKKNLIFTVVYFIIAIVVVAVIAKFMN